MCNLNLKKSTILAIAVAFLNMNAAACGDKSKSTPAAATPTPPPPTPPPTASSQDEETLKAQKAAEEEEAKKAAAEQAQKIAELQAEMKKKVDDMKQELADAQARDASGRECLEKELARLQRIESGDDDGNITLSGTNTIKFRHFRFKNLTTSKNELQIQIKKYQIRLDKYSAERKSIESLSLSKKDKYKKRVENEEEINFVKARINWLQNRYDQKAEKREAKNQQIEDKELNRPSKILPLEGKSDKDEDDD